MKPAPSVPKRLSAGEMPELFRLIFDSAADALLVADDNGIILLANHQCQNLFGRTPAQLEGMSVDDLLPARLRGVHQQHRQRYAQQPSPRPMGVNTALWALRSDGSEVPVEISLSPLRLGSRQLVCANVRDVSEQLRARELALRLNRSELLASFGREALMCRDLVTLSQHACDLALQSLGADQALVARWDRARTDLPADSAVGWRGDLPGQLLTAMAREFSQRTHGTETPEAVDAQADPGDDTLLIEVGSLTKPELANSLAQAGMSCAVICEIAGQREPIGVFSVFSARPRAFTRPDTNFLRTLANTLGAVRQRESTEEQLFQSQRMDALGRLTGGVAHDFNNLLTVISGNLQMLEERPGTESQGKPLIKAALRATRRGSDLTRKLLAFSRRQTLQPRTIEVPTYLESLADILGRTLGPNIEVITACARPIASVLADPGMLDAAMLNLAVNARDAMPSGGRLMLEAHTVSAQSPPVAAALDLAPADYVMIAVSDTGLGMSESVMARAFEPFFTTKEAGKGSGLGLSLVYGFVKQSGGQVRAYSEPGIGTTIKMYLPTVSQTQPAPLPASPRSRTGGTETILVVEDDEAVCEVAAGFLGRLGYSVLRCADAEQALKILAREPAIQLLFTDIVLKRGRNGIELARAAQELRPDLRVVFTSGYAPNVLPLDRELAQGTELLGKPYTIEQLDQILRRALDAPDATSV